MTEQSTRALALARRKALSGAGKAADESAKGNRTRGQSMTRKAEKADPAAIRAQRSSVAGNAPVPNRAVATAASASVSTSRAIKRAASAATNSSRSASLARRKAMSTRGKSAAGSKDRTRSGQRNKPQAASTTGSAAKGDCGCGCQGGNKAQDSADAASTASVSAKPTTRRSGAANRSKLRARSVAATNPTRAASLARRKAQSTRGKAGVSAAGMTPAQTARAGNPELSGRELAQVLREQRSKRGSAGQKKSAPCGRQRPSRSANGQGAAQDAPWKVGVSETSHGQAVTGTMVGRSPDVTGDEASTCRAVTGTEYMGADLFRDFCQAEPIKGFRDSGASATASGNAVTGNEVGRSSKVTGDEPGTCKNVTGTEYVSAEQAETYCGSKPSPAPAKLTRAETRSGKAVTGNNVGRSGKVTGDEVGADRELTGTQYMQLGDDSAPNKVGRSATLRGGAVTGTMVGRHENMTGDEPGSCRNVTGDDYVGEEQYGKFCGSTPKPAPADAKVGVSSTINGERVTGTMTGRAERVTGDEPGTCKSITGTPYAGSEQYAGFCDADKVQGAAARMGSDKRRFGSVMTGIQPGVGGTMTGDEKGACEAVTGTPYVGADQAAIACPSTPAERNSPDFPQALGAANSVGNAGTESWGQFSTNAPMHAADVPETPSNVTGSISQRGGITGPFDMADGKVTGTEEARFGRAPAAASAPMQAEVQAQADSVDGRVKSRVTGEGMNAAGKITGDDWDRGDRVTGTEGASALARNPSRRGSVQTAMGFRAAEPAEAPVPVSRVTGSSGNTENGSLITYSGGARG